MLDRYGLEPSRALGQNFVIDPNTVRRIATLARLDGSQPVVEIGAGLGSLTLALADAGGEVVAIERDRHLLAPLREVLAERTGVRLVHEDALQVDWTELLDDRTWAMVANLPYNVATPLVLDLLATRPEFTRWLVMVQREVGERLAAEPGHRTCGIPSVLVSYWGTASVVGRVSSEVFHPKPRVESVLVQIERSEEPRVEADFGHLSTLVRAGFGQRRKMLRRSLSGHLTSDQIEACNVLPTARAEELDLEAWGRLARFDVGY